MSRYEQFWSESTFLQCNIFQAFFEIPTIGASSIFIHAMTRYKKAKWSRSNKWQTARTFKVMWNSLSFHEKRCMYAFEGHFKPVNWFYDDTRLILWEENVGFY